MLPGSQSASQPGVVQELISDWRTVVVLAGSGLAEVATDSVSQSAEFSLKLRYFSHGERETAVPHHHRHNAGNSPRNTSSSYHVTILIFVLKTQQSIT